MSTDYPGQCWFSQPQLQRWRHRVGVLPNKYDKARKITQYTFEEVNIQTMKFQLDEEKSETTRGMKDIYAGGRCQKGQRIIYSSI